MKITVNLDTQAVITQPSPLRFKGGCFNPVEIGFTRGSLSVPLPDGAVIEFSIKPKNQWTGGLLAYLNAFTPTSGSLYSGSVNCATAALMMALGLSDQVPANDAAQVDASAEVTWSFGGEKFRSITFAVTIEAPITDAEAAATPDPVLYPAPSEVARKSDIPVVGTAARLDAGVANGAATLDGNGKLAGTQIPGTIAFKSDIVPNGANRIVIVNRFSLASLPTVDANGNTITKVNISDVVHQIGAQESRRTAVLSFRGYTITDDDVNNGPHIQFCDENWNCAGLAILDFGGAGTLISAGDLANALVNAINSSGLNVSANVTGDGQLTITSNTTGPLPWGWNFGQDADLATYSETEGVSALPPGDFIVADLNNLGNAIGYQGIGDTVDFLSGYGAPTADIGEEGNGYVDQNNGDFYHRDASGWQFVLNIKGPKGDEGPQGVQGIQGIVGPQGVQGPIGSGDLRPPALVLSKLALLQWPNSYSVAVGTCPYAACYDGANVWVVNYTSNSVTKIVPSSGATTTYAVGTGNPNSICFDGSSLWITYRWNKNLTQLRPSDGVTLNTYNLGSGGGNYPRSLCYDGASLWLADGSSYSISKIDPTSGSIKGSYLMEAADAWVIPECICFDGTNVWVAYYMPSVFLYKVAKIQISNGTVLASYSLPATPVAICFDGSKIWVVCSGTTKSVTVLKSADGSLMGTYSTQSGSGSPASICFDGMNIWIGNSNSTVSKLKASDGSFLGTYSIGTGVPSGMCFDGSNIWVANSTSNNVTKI